jgi:hypothetical protein
MAKSNQIDSDTTTPTMSAYDFVSKERGQLAEYSPTP